MWFDTSQDDQRVYVTVHELPGVSEFDFFIDTRSVTVWKLLLPGTEVLLNLTFRFPIDRYQHFVSEGDRTLTIYLDKRPSEHFKWPEPLVFDGRRPANNNNNNNNINNNNDNTTIPYSHDYHVHDGQQSESVTPHSNLVKATVDFVARSPQELSLRRGMLIRLVDPPAPIGWLRGFIEGVPQHQVAPGLFPSECCVAVPPDAEPGEQERWRGELADLCMPNQRTRGWLWKRVGGAAAALKRVGLKRSSWQRRFAVLDYGKLALFDHDEALKPKSLIALQNVRRVSLNTSKANARKPNCFEIQTGTNRSLYFATEHPDETYHWVRVLQSWLPEVQAVRESLAGRGLPLAQEHGSVERPPHPFAAASMMHQAQQPQAAGGPLPPPSLFRSAADRQADGGELGGAEQGYDFDSIMRELGTVEFDDDEPFGDARGGGGTPGAVRASDGGGGIDIMALWTGSGDPVLRAPKTRSGSPRASDNNLMDLMAQLESPEPSLDCSSTPTSPRSAPSPHASPQPFGGAAAAAGSPGLPVAPAPIPRPRGPAGVRRYTADEAVNWQNRARRGNNQAAGGIGRMTAPARGRMGATLHRAHPPPLTPSRVPPPGSAPAPPQAWRPRQPVPRTLPRGFTLQPGQGGGLPRPRPGSPADGLPPPPKPATMALPKPNQTSQRKPYTRSHTFTSGPGAPVAGSGRGSTAMSSSGDWRGRSKTMSPNFLPRPHNTVRYRALYSFDGEQAGDLSISEGDVIEIDKESLAKRWWKGRNVRTGMFGILPRNFLQGPIE